MEQNMESRLGGGRRRSHRLSAQAVRHATARGLYADGDGLYLLVGRSGTKSWVYRYRQDGRLRDMGLGPLRLVSLAEAREEAQLWRKRRYKVADPIAARRAEKAEKRLEAARAVSFRQCAERYIAAHRAGWKNAKHAAQWPATLATYAYPIFGDFTVQSVDVALVMQALEPIWQNKPETASRVRQRIEAVLDWAKTRGYRQGENPARWRGHLENLLPAPGKIRQVEHHAALPYGEIGAFMAALREQQGIAARALELTILTAARTGEVIGAGWEEFDLAAGMWTVPAGRMKGQRDHRVPLAAPALALLTTMHKTRTSAVVFTGARRGKPISNMAMLMLLRRMGHGELTAHGFRSTFRDWAAECTHFPREIAEMALAHVVSEKVEAAYRRGDLLTKRRQLMEAWARYCGAPPAMGEAIAMRRGEQ
jgi:integrase